MLSKENNDQGNILKMKKYNIVDKIIVTGLALRVVQLIIEKMCKSIVKDYGLIYEDVYENIAEISDQIQAMKKGYTN